MPVQKLADYVLQRVAEAGVRHVFLVPGGGAMHLNDALGRRDDVAFVGTLHEHAAAVAAEAYGKLTGNLGVAMVTSGPGTTNAITGLASAWVNSSPTLFLSGQVKRADLTGDRGLRQYGLQEVHTVEVVRALTKHAVTVVEPASIRRELDRALHLARSGRPGPVWLDLPLDVQAAQIDPDLLEGWTPPPEPPAAALDAAVAEIVAALRTARRPVILAGGGVRMAGAEARFLALAERLGVPVLTTWVATDLVAEDHPLYAGRPGAFASRGANFAVQNSDLLLSLGARWDFGTTGFNPPNFARAARRYVVDVDAAEVKKLEDVATLGVVASAGEFVDALDRATSGERLPSYEGWVARCKGWLARYPVVTDAMRARPDRVSNFAFVERLGLLAPADAVFVQGSAGNQSEVFFMAVPVKAGQRIVADGSYGAMGYGVPAAIGACLASGGRPTLLVDGDGSFFPNVQELAVIARDRLPIKLFVVNNDGYASIRASQSRWFKRMVVADERSGLHLPDIGGVARAFGLPAVRIEKPEELDRKLAEVLALPGPVVCEVHVPADEDRVPRLSNYQKPDGSMGSKPLEDLFPFLDRDELRENLLIPPLEE